MGITSCHFFLLFKPQFLHVDHFPPNRSLSYKKHLEPFFIKRKHFETKLGRIFNLLAINLQKLGISLIKIIIKFYIILINIYFSIEFSGWILIFESSSNFRSYGYTISKIIFFSPIKSWTNLIKLLKATLLLLPYYLHVDNFSWIRTASHMNLTIIH